MTSFAIKIIACISMLVDHAAYCFEPQLNSVSPWLYTACRMFGRIAFPLFAMCIGEGAAHTSSSKRYCWRMLLFALIAQVPFSLMLGIKSPSFTFELFGCRIGVHASFSVMITLLLGLLISSGVHERKFLRAAAALFAACLIDVSIGMDYGITGVLFIFALYLSRENKLCRLLIVLLFSICLYYSPVKEFFKTLLGEGRIVLNKGTLYCAATLIPGLIMLFYNGRKGRSSKLLFYLFYPIHMLLLFILWFVLQLS